MGKLLTDFLKNREKSNPKWENIFFKRSILGLLLFLIYINNLPDGLSSNIKLFADGASLFSVVHCLCNSAIGLNKDLKTINECAFQ